MRWKALERHALEQHRPAVWELEARDEVDRCAFARPVWPDEPCDLSQRSLERKIINCHDATEVFRQSPNLERRGCERRAHAVRGATSVASWRSTNRRSGSNPCGLKRRNSTRTNPMIAPRSASRICGCAERNARRAAGCPGTMGRKRVDSCTRTPMISTPRTTPRMFPRPPTSTMAYRTTTSATGDQADGLNALR